MSICQSFKPGHNVHWIQVREAEEKGYATVICQSLDACQNPEEQPFCLTADPFARHTKNVERWNGKPFYVHNPGALRRLIAQSGTSFTFCENVNLLRGTNPDVLGVLMFYPSFDRHTACIFIGEATPIDGAVTQILIDGALGSLDPELKL